jgi:very-short-patch-repair endonuclease
MESPIEQMFWIACNALCESVSETVNPEPYQNEDGEMLMGRGIFILPQHLVGNYRVDFLLSQNGISPSEFLSPVLVELDGHDFHDKDKRQRSYEKARDRFLVKSGFRVLHFTGSDVFADPFKTAYEALDMIGIGLLGLDKYNPADPLGGGV